MEVISPAPVEVLSLTKEVSMDKLLVLAWSVYYLTVFALCLIDWPQAAILVSVAGLAFACGVIAHSILCDLERGNDH